MSKRKSDGYKSDSSSSKGSSSSSGSDDERSNVCIICLGKKPRAHLGETPCCKKPLHEGCLEQWKFQNNSPAPNCPNCRKALGDVIFDLTKTKKKSRTLPGRSRATVVVDLTHSPPASPARQTSSDAHARPSTSSSSRSTSVRNSPPASLARQTSSNAPNLQILSRRVSSNASILHSPSGSRRAERAMPGYYLPRSPRSPPASQSSFRIPRSPPASP